MVKKVGNDLRPPSGYANLRPSSLGVPERRFCSDIYPVGDEMSEANNNGDQRVAGFSIPVPWSKEPIKVRGLGTIMTLMLVAVSLMTYVLWEHMDQTKMTSEAFISVMKEQTAAQRETTKQQRLMSCIISRPQDVREQEFSSPNSFCQRMAGP